MARFYFTERPFRAFRWSQFTGNVGGAESGSESVSNGSASCSCSCSYNSVGTCSHRIKRPAELRDVARWPFAITYPNTHMTE